MRNKRIDRNKNKRKRRKQKIYIHLSLFIFTNIIVAICFSVPMIYYGPMVNIRETIVTSAMTTLSHQYLATAFLSKNEIQRILDKNKIDDNRNSNVDQIDIPTFSQVPQQPVDLDKPRDPYDGIKLIDISNDKYKGHILIIADPKRISVGISPNLGKTGSKLDEIIKAEGAIAGINAGGFEDEGGHGNGGQPLGLVVRNGEILHGKEKVEYSVVGFNSEGVLVLGKYDINSIKRLNIKEAVTFYPFLIVNGEGIIKEGNGGWGIAPRTAIGQRRDGAVVMLVIDGRQVSSIGATLRDVQDLLLKYDVYNAANLDGGSSTTMYYKNKIINSPSSIYGPRYLPTAFVIK